MSVAKVRRPNCKCKTCGIAFWIKNRELRLGRGIYCSRKCQHFKTPEQRFWEKVDKAGDCWVWRSTTNSSGYGWMGIKGKMVAAHRYSWELHNGRIIPKGMYICHTCDNPPCVNPSHLFLGTSKDNTADKMAKGRMKTTHHKGELNGQAILTETQVIAMRSLRATKKLTYEKLGEMFGVTMSAAHRICTGGVWKHLLNKE